MGVVESGMVGETGGINLILGLDTEPKYAIVWVMELTATTEILIDGTAYKARNNDDAECPVSLARVYLPGDKRTLTRIGAHIFQTMQDNGSWLTTKTVRTLG